MSKHTPGPWHAKASPASAYFEWTVHGKRITVGVDTDNSEADAKLIAAAPDLLQALERLLAWSESEGLPYGRTLVDEARAAVVKAIQGDE